MGNDTFLGATCLHTPSKTTNLPLLPSVIPHTLNLVSDPIPVVLWYMQLTNTIHGVAYSPGVITALQSPVLHSETAYLLNCSLSHPKTNASFWNNLPGKSVLLTFLTVLRLVVCEVVYICKTRILSDKAFSCICKCKHWTITRHSPAMLK